MKFDVFASKSFRGGLLNFGTCFLNYTCFWSCGEVLRRSAKVPWRLGTE